MTTTSPAPPGTFGPTATHVRVGVPRGVADDAVRASLWSGDPLGLWETSDEIVAYYATDAPADLPQGATVEREQDQDWNERWKAGLEPVQAGRFRVVPTWLATPSGNDHGAAADGTVELVLDPGEAFGTGHHATTALCLELLDGLVDDGRLDGARVADLGSGSGLLAIAAAASGAGSVRACDLDRAAVAATARNAEANDVEVTAVQGSVGALADEAPYDVVFANLLTDTITELAPRLRELLTRGGVLVVSGIGARRAHGPLRALADQRMRLRGQRGRDGWIAAALTR